MTFNLINQYVDLTKKQMNAYMKLVYGTKLNKKYSDSFLEKYINTRYYNYYEVNTEKNMKNKILYELKEAEEDLILANIDDRGLIENMNKIFQYVLYFDNIIKYKDLNSIIDKIAKQRTKILNKTKEGFEKQLYDIVTEHNKQKQELIQRFENDTFYLKLKNYPNKVNIFKVSLRYNIEIPPEYSDFAIDKAFNSGIISEDKLTVEYYLVALQVLDDILKQNYKSQYILEFADTLFKKANKLRQLLNILNNVGLQDRTALKIRYETYLKNREKCHIILRQGYKIAILIDNSFTLNKKNLEALKMFKYVILDSQLETYDEIRLYRDELQNIIEI